MRAAQPHELEITLSVDLRSVPHVRRFVGNWFGTVLREDDDRWRAELACHELLENAVKCTSTRTATLAVTIIDSAEYRRLIVSTRNYSSPANMTILQRDIEDIRQASDAFEHYQKVMRATAERREGSGLGLARVRAEAEMELDTFCANGMVTVMAHTTLRRSA